MLGSRSWPETLLSGFTSYLGIVRHLTILSGQPCTYSGTDLIVEAAGDGQPEISLMRAEQETTRSGGILCAYAHARRMAYMGGHANEGTLTGVPFGIEYCCIRLTHLLLQRHLESTMSSFDGM
jgi:hypothetical protein